MSATEPTEASTPEIANLEKDVEEWAVYTEGAPLWDLKNVDVPSLDGQALQCSITGGDPFSNVHCYRNLPAEPEANSFVLSMSFLFTPDTTCNNQGSASAVQAIEFTMNKWHEDQRYEIALQWQNVGDGAPQWRYWDANQPPGNQWVGLNPNISQCLEADEWHSFALNGGIVNNQIYYQSFTIDEQTHQLGLAVLPAAVPGEIDRLAIAIQLDGNSNQTPYNVYIDQVTFIRGIVTSETSTSVLASTSTSGPLLPTETHVPESEPDCSMARIDALPTDSDGQVDRSLTISWTPASCPMNVQFYQDGLLIRENKEGDMSGTVNMSGLPPGLTEIKIWVPGSTSPADAIWVQLK
ncbi:MAG TPA: hypothetical protein VK897_26195 [Anaerolineales bacterium]|nr:hypothetical protein [Anaerolineales bacterium]